jgi:hypothetical protein
LIEQRGDRRVIGAGPWPEPAGRWWRWCQSLGRFPGAQDPPFNARECALCQFACKTLSSG